MVMTMVNQYLTLGSTNLIIQILYVNILFLPYWVYVTKAVDSSEVSLSVEWEWDF